MVELAVWSEKYRPTKLSEVINQKHVVERVKAFVKENNIPHMLFAGSAGTGKTTVALCIAHELYGKEWRQNVLEMNSSDERGIDIVRGRIKDFARTKSMGEVPFRMIVLDEADNLCLHPDTEVIVGDLSNPKVVCLKDLPKNATFDIASFNTKTWSIENDKGVLVESGKAQLYEITFDNGKKVMASLEHPFFTIVNNEITVLKTKELKRNMELLCVNDRFLRCQNCDKLFFRKYPYHNYLRHFCSLDCRNTFLALFSKSRNKKTRREIGKKGANSLWKILHEDENRFKIYREKHREKLLKLLKEGRITPRLLKKGEGPWLNRRLSKEHKEKIKEKTREFFNSPRGKEVRLLLSKSTREMNLNNPKLRKWYKSEKFKEHIRKLGINSQQIRKGYKNLEDKFAFLLDKINVKYSRQVPIVGAINGKKLATVVDFLVGQVAVYINGCFWHCCPVCGINANYKFQRNNIIRDELSIDLLEKLGYKVLVFWEHELKNENEIKPRIYEGLGISGHGRLRLRKVKVKSIKYVGKFDVLNISVKKNKNFFLANGVLTHNTSDAQNALRRTMENFTSVSRFILIGNYSSRIIEPLQSRTAVFRFKTLIEADIKKFIERIVEGEKLKITDGAVAAIIYLSEGDLRKVANMLQASAALGEKITETIVYDIASQAKPTDVKEMLELALSGEFETARKRLQDMLLRQGLSGEDIIREIHRQIYSLDISEQAKVQLIEKTGEYEYRISEGSSDLIQLEALLAQFLLFAKKS
jgi:replication factor C small subunit